MSMQAQLEQRLNQAFEPLHLEVANESHMHNVPAGSELHFKVLVVANAFENQPRVARHRLVNDAVAAQLSAGIHAFSINAMTPDEWLEQAGQGHASPPCLGGFGA